MGERALEQEWKKVLKATSKFNRSRVDKYTQIYFVSLSDIKTEVYKALSLLLPPGIKVPAEVDKHCSDYCRQLYIRYKAVAKAGRTKKIQYTIEGTSTNFVVIATSVGTTAAERAQVNRELNAIRTNKSGGVVSNSLKQLNIKDLNSDKSPLGLLRANILKSVFEINVDNIDLSQDSKVLDVILGARYTDKKTGEYTNKREAGLLHFGHLEGFAVVEQRATEIISRIRKKTEVEIGTATLEKYLNERARIGDILGSFNVRLDLKNTAAGKDEFNVDNMSKQEENQLIKSLKQEFFSNGQKWARQHGSSSIIEKGDEVLTYMVTDIVTAAFSKASKGTKSRIKYTPSKNRRPKKEPKSKTKAIPITREVREQRDTYRSQQVPDSKKGTIKGSTSSVNNWSRLLPVINSKLTPRVIANMRFPSLVNRTGTFANSAKVVNVEQTREGFPTFVFDYERDPYNVFDRNLGRSPWNTPERDPRALVDKSVREIVREMAIGRFYTRRA
jgi:hypothetical protein